MTEKMTEILYIDCFSGISGDMMLAALIDAGIDILFLKNELEKININGYEIESVKIKRSEVSATKFKVTIKEKQPLRTYSDIINLIKNSKIDEKAKQNALSIFEIIASAEAKVHQIEKDKVHFHEIGAVDSIIDIVGTAICMAKLEIDDVYCSSIPLGSGFIKTMHGILPVPAPATMEILKDVPVYSGNLNFEATTPTGAAIVKNYVKHFGSIPLMKIKNIGFGSGSNEDLKIPDLLRIIFGQLLESEHAPLEMQKNQDINCDNLIMLSTNIDDISAEIIGYLIERLFKEDIADAWTEPIFMKKNRQAVKINVLCKPEDEIKICNLLFSETSTLGIRRQAIQRYSLNREIVILKLPYGEIKVKVAYKDDKVITYSPEYESCKILAQKTGKPIKDIYNDALCKFKVSCDHGLEDYMLR